MAGQHKSSGRLFVQHSFLSGQTPLHIDYWTLAKLYWGERSPQGLIHIGKNKDMASNFVSKLGSYFSQVFKVLR